MTKVQIFEFGSKSPLDPKFGPRGPNHPKTDCWGPGESIDTHIVGFCEKSTDFYRLPQGKSRLGRDQLTSSCSGDNFAALHAVLPFILCYAMTVKNNLVIFYRLSTDLLCYAMEKQS